MGLCSCSPKILAKHANPFILPYQLDTLFWDSFPGDSDEVTETVKRWPEAKQVSIALWSLRAEHHGWFFHGGAETGREGQWGESAVCLRIMAETWFSMSSPPRNPHTPTTVSFLHGHWILKRFNLANQLYSFGNKSFSHWNRYESYP